MVKAIQDTHQENNHVKAQHICVPSFSRSDSQAVGRMPGRLLMGQTVFCEPCSMKRLLSSACNLDFGSWSGLFRSRFQLSFRYSPHRRAANPSLHSPSESAPKGHHHEWSKTAPKMDPEQLNTLFRIKYYIDVTSHDLLLAKFYRCLILLDRILPYIILPCI